MVVFVRAGLRWVAPVLFALAGVVGLGVPAGAQGATTVLHAHLEGAVTPVTAEYLVDAVAEAEAGGHEALVVQIDTPGGLDAAMRQIVTAFLNAEVPVVAYVAPSGARAASAGAVIALSAHVAAMAPGTNIGAATPIDLQGGEVIDKVVNDAAAYVAAIAEERGRDVEFAEAMVRDGESIPAGEAVEREVVDLEATDIDELLSSIDGREVTLADGTEVALATADAALIPYAMSWVRELLQRIADPNLAFLFLSLGTLAILYEIANPGVGVGGIAGAILLILAFYALSVLPVNLAGVALIVLAMVLFVAELFVPGVGVLGGGGAVALLLGGLLLFQRPTGIGVDLAVLMPTVALVGLGAVGLAVMAGRLRSRPPRMGERALVGRRAQVRIVDGDESQVWVDGALWRARSRGAQLVAGATVVVIDQDGLTLTVVPEPDTASDTKPEQDAAHQQEDPSWNH